MIGITLTSEQIRSAPAEVRRWIEREVMTSLGQQPQAADGGKPHGEHLAVCSAEQAQAVLVQIQSVLPVVNVFFELGRQGAIFGLFVGIAIFIACLGLFGLAAFTAGRRTKEIGIRKVFGARTREVIFLLLWQFSIPVLVANAIAWPLAWFYLHNWLEGYSYRISLNPAYFLVVGAAALAIAWATIFTHARRVAGANPIHALRYE